MKFIDQTQIFVNAGNGGPGIVSFAAAFGAPKLGPDGGNGGNGGSGDGSDGDGGSDVVGGDDGAKVPRIRRVWSSAMGNAS